MIAPEIVAEAVRALDVSTIRHIATQSAHDAPDALRRRIVPRCHGWRHSGFSGRTTPKGYEITPDNEPTVLVTWKTIVAHQKLAEIDAVAWPRGVDDYYRLFRRAHAPDEWIDAQIRTSILTGNDQQLTLL